MADDLKKIEITHDFLEKHRSNTRKYMHLLSKANEKPDSIQETLTRIESKFGLNIKRSNSHEVPQVKEKTQETESVQDFIKQIRAKYLTSDEPAQELAASLALQKPLLEFDQEKTEIRRNKSEIMKDLIGLEIRFDKKDEESLDRRTRNDLPEREIVVEGNKGGVAAEDFEGKDKRFDYLVKEKGNVAGNNEIVRQEQGIKSIEKVKEQKHTPILPQKNNRIISKDLSFEEDNELLLSDLITDPPASHYSPVNKPPRSKVVDEIHEEPHVHDINRSLNENSMSMSFRRVHAEQLLNSAISEVISARLRIKKKPQIPSKNFSFETFLNSGKVKFAPLKKVVNFDQIFKNDEVLKELLWKKEMVLKEIDILDKEKIEILDLMNKS